MATSTSTWTALLGTKSQYGETGHNRPESHLGNSGDLGNQMSFTLMTAAQYGEQPCGGDRGDLGNQQQRPQPERNRHSRRIRARGNGI